MSIWFRHYIGLTTDPKFGGIARRSRESRERVVFVWCCILESASELEESGVFIVDPDGIAELLHCETESIERILEQFAASGLTKGSRVEKWETRQFLSDNSTQRVKKYRENQRDMKRNAAETFHDRFGNVSETPPEAEAEAEADSETEAETEVSQRRGVNARADAPIPKVAAPANQSPSPATATKAPKARKGSKNTICPDWTPAESTYALLEKHGIGRSFSEGCVDEFRLYWQERGKALAGFEAAFFNNVKRQWERKPSCVAAPSPVGRAVPGGGRARGEAARASTDPRIAEVQQILAGATRAVIEGECAHVTH